MYGLDTSLSQPATCVYTSAGQSIFTLPYVLQGPTSAIVFVAKVPQYGNYTIVGNTLTFDFTVPAGIEVLIVPRGVGRTQTVNLSYPISNAGGTADALTGTYTVPNTVLTNNLLLNVVVTTANLTDTPTFSPDGLAPKIIIDYDGSALSAGSLKLGSTVLLRYDSSDDKWWIASSGGGSSSVGRLALTGSTPTPILGSNGSFAWTLIANSTLGFPTVVPSTGSWYIDITVNATGGYSLSFAAGYNKVYGYYFDCVPNAVYRLWMVSRGSSIIDVNIERIV